MKEKATHCSGVDGGKGRLDLRKAPQRKKILNWIKE